ncbi:inactive rhomboid protein 1 isoform X2 [Exaiptasia diaphana]|uniref:Peptidase S54 rhomboid domain-containing protein n=1 Tax=Exaiptasia diaphana TaxID=2652724 RepID=A0A913X5S9_EXADI|nr:inactive rhomboid protein 1 isoform X2 [Exaiptasia diaphana]
MALSPQTPETWDSFSLPSVFSSSHSVPQPVSLAKSGESRNLRRKIVKSTEQFFGLCEDEEEQSQLERKWTQRKIRHYGKRYGGFADVVQDAVDAAKKKNVRLPSESSLHSTASSMYDPTLVRTKSRRQSVAKMAWKGLKMKAKAGTLVSEVSKVPPVSCVHEEGRSFCPAMFAEEELEEGDQVDSPFAEPMASSKVDDEVFFDFISERAKLAKKEISLPPIPEDKDVGVEEEEEKEPIDEEMQPLTPHDETDRAPQQWLGPKAAGPQVSIRGKRMAKTPPAVNANRREYGKGLVGRWLNRSVSKKRLPSTVRKQLESLSDHRPFFTYWVSFVQVVVLIVTLSVYNFAPIGFTKTERAKIVRKSRQGTLVPEYLKTYDQDNFWIGPNQEALIHLGAKFAPCMRNDKLLVRALEREREEESKTGCCIKTDNSGCIQTSRLDCKRAFTNFIMYSKNNLSRAVCGQDPQLCQDPPSVKPYEWSDVITDWPICKRTRTNVSAVDFPQMTCEVTARPCCIKTQARCQILSRDECNFMKGYFHENATLCSQVDCLGNICGMIPFLKKNVADQIYRLWMAIFLHAGLIHLACTLVFNFTILRDLEKLCGWIRIGIVYVFSGIGGYLVSAILIPYQVEVGPSGSMFGIIACLFVELIQSWQMVNHPIIALFKLCGVVFLLLLVGLLPYVDNFAHMAGFMFGFFLAFIFIPYVTFGTWDKRRKRIQILVAFAVLIILFVVLFIIFLDTQTATCVGCAYLNCVPFTVDFCEPYHLGQKLQPR